MGFFRLVVAGSLAGALVGLLTGGVGGRIAMRIAALMGGGSNVSVSGTLELILIAGIVGTVMGAVLAGLQKRRLLSAPRLGSITGTILLMGFFIDPGARTALLHSGVSFVNVPMFFGVGFLYGILWVPATSRLLGRLPEWKFGGKREAGR